MAMPSITCEIVRDLLNYDPETGIFTWRHRDRKYFNTDRAPNPWNARYAGKEAGRFTHYGYIQIKIFEYDFYAHRLAYLYMTGSFPEMEIDHKDRNKSNNRFENLRVVSKAVNMQNTFNPYRSNKLKVRGVRQTVSKKFDARISVRGKDYQLGTFSTPEEASAAYLAAKQRLHPDAVQTLDTA
jgi:hypothetical protein